MSLGTVHNCGQAHVRRHSGRPATIILFSLIATSCGTAPSVAQTAESESIREIQSIALPPVILPGGVHNDRITREAFEQLTMSLALKGYVMHRVKGLSIDSSVDPAALRGLGPEALSSLLPEGGTHYLLCWIDYTAASPGATAVTAGPLRASAVLIDRNQKRVLWQNLAYLPATDPLQTKMAAFTGALMLNRMSPPPAFYTPAMRQFDFENRMNQLEQGYQMAESLASPVANTLRALLSTLPERPMR